LIVELLDIGTVPCPEPPRPCPRILNLFAEYSVIENGTLQNIFKYRFKYRYRDR
jgi:hypothetical protein